MAVNSDSVPWREFVWMNECLYECMSVCVRYVRQKVSGDMDLIPLI